MFEVLMKKENERLMIVISLILIDMFIVLGQIFLLGKLNQYIIINVNRFVYPIISVSVAGLFCIFDFSALTYIFKKTIKGNH